MEVRRLEGRKAKQKGRRPYSPPFLLLAAEACGSRFSCGLHYSLMHAKERSTSNSFLCFSPEMVKVLVAVPRLLDAARVKPVAATTVVGVPVIAPVVGLKVRPGMAAVTEDQGGSRAKSSCL